MPLTLQNLKAQVLLLEATKHEVFTEYFVSGAPRACFHQACLSAKSLS